MSAACVGGAVRLELGFGAEPSPLGGAVGGGLTVIHAINAARSPSITRGPGAARTTLHPATNEHVGAAPHLVDSLLDGAVRVLDAVGVVISAAGCLVAARKRRGRGRWGRRWGWGSDGRRGCSGNAAVAVLVSDDLD